MFTFTLTSSMKVKKANKSKVQKQMRDLCNAQEAYTNYKADMLRYDIAKVLCSKSGATKKDRKAISANLFAKHKCAESAEKLSVYDRFIYDSVNKDIDHVYSKHSRGLKRKVSSIKKNHPNYNAEDVFRSITHCVSIKSK